MLQGATTRPTRGTLKKLTFYLSVGQATCGSPSTHTSYVDGICLRRETGWGVLKNGRRDQGCTLQPRSTPSSSPAVFPTLNHPNCCLHHTFSGVALVTFGTHGELLPALHQCAICSAAATFRTVEGDFQCSNQRLGLGHKLHSLLYEIQHSMARISPTGFYNSYQDIHSICMLKGKACALSPKFTIVELHPKIHTFIICEI